MKPNELTELFAEDRAVSPVVGVALLIAITVILAAVIGGVVLGLGTGGAEVPQAQLNADFDEDDQSVDINHNGGEPLPEDQITIVYESDDTDSEVAALDGDLTAGDSENVELGELIDAEDEFEDGVTVTVVWEDPNSDSESILAEFEE